MLGFGAVIPMLPVYLHEQAGAARWFTGLLIGLASAYALLGRLFAGKKADRQGRRIALLLGMALCVVAGVLYLPVFGLWAMPPARVLHGLGEGFFVTACVAWAVDVAPDNRRAQALGFLSSGIWGGVSIGPAIGPCCYEVGPDVLEAFERLPHVMASAAFQPDADGHADRNAGGGIARTGRLP